MSGQEVTIDDIAHLTETVVTFTKMVKKTELVCKTNADVLSAMKCACQVENIYCELRGKRLLFLFIRQMCKALQISEDSYDISKMQYACDTLLEAVLTSKTVSSSSLLCCLNNYIELRGKERFTQIVSALIVKSEACRVLLDYIRLVEDNAETSIIFQANILLRILTSKHEAAVVDAIHNWITSDAENRLAVVFQAISEAGMASNISKALIQGLVSVLDDRKETAALYLSAVVSSQVSLTILKTSKSLFYASLDFLTKCAGNFELTPHLTWGSCEDGPCQMITYDMIVKYINFLKSDNELAILVDTFLCENCTLPGCTFWEDILESFPT